MFDVARKIAHKAVSSAVVGSTGRAPGRMSDLIFRVTHQGVPGVWTDNRIEQTRHFKHWMYVAINARAWAVADSPMCVGRRKRSTAKRGKHVKAINPLRHHETVEALDDDHWLSQLFDWPNEMDSFRDLMYETSMFLDLTGSAYWWKRRNVFGRVCELWCLPSHWVWAIPGRDKVIESFEVRPVEGGYLNWSFDANDIIAFKYKSPISKIDGWSPATAGSRWIDISESVDTSQWADFKNGSRPGVAIKLPPEYADPTEGDIRRIEAKFLGKFGGEWNHGKPLILAPGMEIEPWTKGIMEMDYATTQDGVRDKVLSLFRTPPSVAGISGDMTYDNVWASLFSFYTHAVKPIIGIIDDGATRGLAHEISDDVLCYHEDRTPVDPNSKRADWQLALDHGAASFNEYRVHHLNLPPWRNGDDPMVPVGFAPFPMDQRPEDLDAPPEKEEVQLLGEVGGITGAITILTQVSAGAMSEDSAVELLVLFFKIDEEEARAIIGDAASRQPNETKPEKTARFVTLTRRCIAKGLRPRRRRKSKAKVKYLALPALAPAPTVAIPPPMPAPAPNVTLNPTFELTMPPINITVPVSVAGAEAPTVNFAPVISPTPVEIKNTLDQNVIVQPADTLAPVITVTPKFKVVVPKPALMRKEVVRDADGRVTEIIDVPVEETNDESP